MPSRTAGPLGQLQICESKKGRIQATNMPRGVFFFTESLCFRYNLVFLAVTYLMPMTVMAVCYTLMGIELWGSRSIGEFTQRQMDSIKSKRKVCVSLLISITMGPTYVVTVGTVADSVFKYYRQIKKQARHNAQHFRVRTCANHFGLTHITLSTYDVALLLQGEGLIK